MGVSGTDSAYAAGFLDGEGYIAVLHGRGASYHLEVTASQKTATPLEWLRDRWGGSVRLRLVNTNPIFCWTLYANRALAFLEDVRPWLIVKAEQADIAIAYQRA